MVHVQMNACVRACRIARIPAVFNLKMIRVCHRMSCEVSVLSVSEAGKAWVALPGSHEVKQTILIVKHLVCVFQFISFTSSHRNLWQTPSLNYTIEVLEMEHVLASVPFTAPGMLLFLLLHFASTQILAHNFRHVAENEQRCLCAVA